jgi:hypothetical protein
MALCYGQKSDFNQATKLLGGGKDPHAPGATLAYFYGMSGQTNRARALAAELIKANFPRVHIATALVGIGDKDQALVWLEKAVDQRDERVVMLQVDPHFDSLRSDPRFDQLLSRVGL